MYREERKGEEEVVVVFGEGLETLVIDVDARRSIIKLIGRCPIKTPLL
jgi:hypothetical protein